MRYLKYLSGAVFLLAVGLSCDKKAPRDAPVRAKEHAGRPDETTPAIATSESPWKANDVHTHLSPAAYPLAIKMMNRNDIRRVVNLSGGRHPRYRRANLARADQYDGRIALFTNIDWSIVDEPEFGRSTAASLQRAVSRGFAGLKITKQLGLGVRSNDGQLLEVDDPRLDPVWEEAGALGIPIGIHTGDPKAFFEKAGPQNERWEELKLAPDWSFYGEEYPSRHALLAARDRVVERHPHTTFILLHLANNPENLDYVDRLLDDHPNVVVDLAARIAEIGRHNPKRVHQFFVKHQNRILFGTDLGLRARHVDEDLEYRLTLGSISKTPPTLDDVPGFYDAHWRYFESDTSAIAHPVPIQGDWKVHPIDLPQNILDKVYWKNAERIIFGPWLARRAARRIADRSARIIASRRSPAHRP